MTEPSPIVVTISPEQVQRIENLTLHMERLSERSAAERTDVEADHIDADETLLQVLGMFGQQRLVRAFQNLHKWYA